jgi:TolB protein
MEKSANPAQVTAGGGCSQASAENFPQEKYILLLHPRRSWLASPATIYWPPRRRNYFVNLNMLKTIVALLALSVLSATAQVVVSKSAGEKMGVDLSGVQAGGGAAQAVRRTFENDVARSGWMEVAAPGKGTVTVRGSISESGGQVSFACVATDPAGRAYLNATYAQPTANAIYAAHQAANDIVVKATGKPTFFLGKLALIGTRSGAKELYLADSSAQDVRQVTQDKSIALKPRWSPDNQFISYTSYLKRWPDVYTIELATGSRNRAAAYAGVNSGGAISPDGRSMVLILSKDGNPDLYVQDLSSKRLVRLTNTPRATEGSPCWAPDGSRIAYVSDASGTPQLYLITRSGGTPERLTFRGTQNVSPDWGANGLIAYQTLSGGKFQIAVIDPAAKQERVITPYDASYEDPSWAPDNRHLAASRSVNYNYSVYLLDSMGDKPVALTTSGDWYAPAWSH